MPACISCHQNCTAGDSCFASFTVGVIVLLLALLVLTILLGTAEHDCIANCTPWKLKYGMLGFYYFAFIVKL